jgi:hypothetical protein
MKMVKKKKNAARRSAREEHKLAKNAKKEHRKRDRKTYTADMWAVPPPSHLVARLEVPKHKSKYHSYFEFAENTEKKKKKLEFKVGCFHRHCATQLNLHGRLQMIRIHHQVSNLFPLEIQP